MTRSETKEVLKELNRSAFLGEMKRRTVSLARLYYRWCFMDTLNYKLLDAGKPTIPVLENPQIR